MIKIKNCAAIDPMLLPQLAKILSRKKPEKKWDSQAQAAKAFKTAVFTQGLDLQSHQCAWCTLPIGETGRRTAHRDHIAPSALWEKWTFTAKNIVLTCEYCNGLAVKRDLDTVAKDAANYDDVLFHIVHPYLDDVFKHIEFNLLNGAPGVTISALTKEGQFTIDNLKLDTPSMTAQRAKEYDFAEKYNSLPPHYANLLSKATARAP